MVYMQYNGFSGMAPARRAFSGIKQQDKRAEIYRNITYSGDWEVSTLCFGFCLFSSFAECFV